MTTKIAITGTHGSGKSTLISEVYSRVKKKNIRVNMTVEVARKSIFLASKEITPTMQLDLFGKQISEEMEASRNCDLLLCDRSIVDILMYTRLFFPDDDQAKSYCKAMEDFAKQYCSTYNYMFKLSTIYSTNLVKDDIRPKDRELQVAANEAIENELKALGIDFIELPTENPANFLVEFIQSEIIKEPTEAKNE